MPKVLIQKKNKRASQLESRTFGWILFASLMIHLSMIVWWLWAAPKVEDKRTSQSTQVSIQMVAPEQSNPEPDTKAPDRSEPEKIDQTKREGEIEREIVDEYRLGDELESNNQTDPSQTAVDRGIAQLIEEIGGTEGLPDTKESKVSERVKTDSYADLAVPLNQDGDALSQSETPTESDELREDSEKIGDNAFLDVPSEMAAKERLEIAPVLDIPPEFLGNLGNMQQLSDIDLDKAEVRDPFTQREAKEFRAVNFYLKKISDQILSVWVNPLTLAEQRRRLSLEIRMEIDLDGRLIKAWTHLPSTLNKYEDSLLAAIQSIDRFDTTSPVSIRQKYRYLRLMHSSTGFETELMPFEKSIQKEEAKTSEPTQTGLK